MHWPLRCTAALDIVNGNDRLALLAQEGGVVLLEGWDVGSAAWYGLDGDVGAA
jgi:hypothetical protein